MARGRGELFSTTVVDSGRVVIPAALGIVGKCADVVFRLREDHVTLLTRMRELKRRTGLLGSLRQAKGWLRTN